MKTNVERTLLALGVLALIAACDRPKPLAEVEHGVAEQKAEVASADANYKLAMEQASGNRDIALKKCEGLADDQQKACKDRASADFSTALAQAEKMRSAQTPPQ